MNSIDAADLNYAFLAQELWQYRELALVFATRDLKVRYRQAVIGIAWAVLQPLVMMSLFMVFTRWSGKTPSAHAETYAVSSYIGLLIWQLFSYTVRESTTSLVGHRDLVTKVYFPRLLLPLSTALCALVDFGFAFLVLVPLMWWTGIVPGMAVLLFPIWLLLALLTSIAVGIWLSALNALYRDIGYVVPFLLQIGLFVTPVLYETRSVVPAQWQGLWALNPLVGMIEGCRWSLMPAGSTDGPSVVIVVLSLCSLVALLVSGLWYFRRAEQWIADRI
ncbi:ABC transporter permease [bacterium]|nr:ABC transporter permease [bacterium]